MHVAASDKQWGDLQVEGNQLALKQSIISPQHVSHSLHYFS